jgi:hypothetical protein
LALAALLGVRSAECAETPEPAALSWVRGEGADACPAAPEIARLVEARLGRDALTAPARAALVVEAYVSPGSAGHFHVTIALTKGGTVIGRRELDGSEPGCTEIAEKAALTIALMIDPEARVAEPEPPPAPVPSAVAPAAPVAAPAPPKPTPRAEQPPAARWGGDAELAFGAISGLIPGLAPGVFARGRAWPPWFPAGLELEAGYLPQQTASVEPGKTGTFTLLEGGVALCNRSGRAHAVALSGCAGVEIGSISGRGSGFAYTPSYQAWLFALAARGRVWFRPLRGLALVAGPDVALPLKRDVFEATTPTTGTVPLWRVAAVAVGFEVGAVLEL